MLHELAQLLNRRLWPSIVGNLRAVSVTACFGVSQIAWQRPGCRGGNSHSAACQEGAVDVFLDFISYSGGPLAEDLLEVIQQPVSILWGECAYWSVCTCGHSHQPMCCLHIAHHGHYHF